jgi:hypothetical protein
MKTSEVRSSLCTEQHSGSVPKRGTRLLQRNIAQWKKCARWLRGNGSRGKANVKLNSGHMIVLPSALRPA